jgi:hypothetical protein
MQSQLLISVFLLIMILALQDPLLILHSIIQEKQIKKLYLALASAPVPTGIMSHYMRPVNVAPRLVSEGYCEDLCLFLCSLYSLQELLRLSSLLDICDNKLFRFTLYTRASLCINMSVSSKKHMARLFFFFLLVTKGLNIVKKK